MSANLPTPIPLGSPHLRTPPTLDRWGLGTQKRKRLDQRDYERREAACDLWLSDVRARNVLRCRVTDISDAGLYASAPIGYGLAIGQRYELRIVVSDRATADSPPMTKSLGYATIIRTEIEATGSQHDRVGFAVRFDVPQLLPV
ncbi:hypothetical protein RAS2_23540 [Phycisphaerae bacterium RAS2]|nr:hypothetical protein RAS2_23540 [Phycisphaerae bacterium RAS2]